jgi:hypothetical protein
LPFRLVNNYGVSEATVVSTSGTVTPADAAGGCADLPTLGSAIPGVKLTVVDPDGPDWNQSTSAVGESAVAAFGERTTVSSTTRKYREPV